MGKLIDEIMSLVEAVKTSKEESDNTKVTSGKPSGQNKDTMVAGKDPKIQDKNLEYDSQVPGHKVPKVNYQKPANTTVAMNTQPQMKGKSGSDKFAKDLEYDNQVPGHKIPKVNYNKGK